MKAAEVMVSAVISTRPNGQEQLKHREERFFIGLRNRRDNEISPQSRHRHCSRAPPVNVKVMPRA